MKYILTILLFISVQSFGQTPVIKEFRYNADSGRYSIGAKYDKNVLDIDVVIGANNDSVHSWPDTIWTSKILRFQTNNNSSLLMTKVKYLVRKIVNGKEVWEADDRKVYDIFQYYSTVYNIWTQL